MYNVQKMTDLRFAWDDRKNQANRRKHGVSFEEDQTAFHDENAKVYYDPDHSAVEDRFSLLGLTLRVVVVCHCHREEESIVRIISARNANRRERNDYWRESDESPL